MTFFDMKTLLLAGVFSELISTFVFAGFWFHIRKRYKGIGKVTIGFFVFTFAWLLVALRDSVLPEFVTMLLPNTMAVGGTYLVLNGLHEFLDRKEIKWFNILILLIFPLLHSYFLYVQPNLDIRGICLFAALGVYCGQNAWLLLHKVEKHNRSITRTVGVVYVFLTIHSIMRVLQLTLFPAGENNFLKSNNMDGVFIILLQMLVLLLTFSMILMVNKRLMQYVHEQEEKYSKVFYHAPYAITIKRLKDEEILEVNEGFCRVTGFRQEEVVGRTMQEIGFWKDKNEQGSILRELTEFKMLKDKEIRFCKKNGQEFIGLYSSEIIMINGEEYILSVINDISERKHSEEKIQHMATHDALTDLPGLRLAHYRLLSAIREVDRNQTKVAVMYIDLDGFKSINDNYGHKAGDYVLQQVAVRLQKNLRMNDTVARIGGDEFLLIASNITDTTAASHIAEKVLANIALPLEVDGHQVSVGASLGIALYPEDGEDIDNLIRTADDAMYRIKKSGKNGYAFHT